MLWLCISLFRAEVVLCCLFCLPGIWGCMFMSPFDCNQYVSFVGPFFVVVLNFLILCMCMDNFIWLHSKLRYWSSTVFSSQLTTKIAVLCSTHAYHHSFHSYVARALGMQIIVNYQHIQLDGILDVCACRNTFIASLFSPSQMIYMFVPLRLQLVMEVEKKKESFQQLVNKNSSAQLWGLICVEATLNNHVNCLFTVFEIALHRYIEETQEEKTTTKK